MKSKKIKVEFETKGGESIFVDAIQTYQPERSKREDSFDICAKCGLKFDPCDWENDICDKCLYKKRDAVL